MFVTDIPDDIDDATFARVLLWLRERTLRQQASTSVDLQIGLGMTKSEAEAALAYLLRSSLPMIALTLQRGFGGRWIECYQALLDGQHCFNHSEEQAEENLRRFGVRVIEHADGCSTVVMPPRQKGI